MHATAQGLAAERGMLEARAPNAQVERVGAEEPPAAGVPGTRALDGGMVDTKKTRSTAVYADSAANEVWKAAEAGRSTIQRTVWSEDRSSGKTQRESSTRSRHSLIETSLMYLSLGRITVPKARAPDVENGSWRWGSSTRGEHKSEVAHIS